MNIKDIAERAYDNAERLGKIGDRTEQQKVKDLYSEYLEAWNALSKKHFADRETIQQLISNISVSDSGIWTSIFENDIHNTYEDELTDCLFVVLTLMKDKNMDIEKHITAKMKYNELREDHIKTP